MTPPNIELHIEELVLDGFAPGDRQQIGAAVERELAALFAEQGAPQEWGRGAALAYVDGGSVTLSPEAKPDAVGGQIARAVYGGLQR
jgi:hypothetical protein